MLVDPLENGCFEELTRCFEFGAFSNWRSEVKATNAVPFWPVAATRCITLIQREQAAFLPPL